MNELIELWNNTPYLVTLSEWFMNMTLYNLGFLVWTLMLWYTLSLSTTVNGHESNLPKHIITVLTIALMVMFPNSLWIASIPFTFVLLSLIINPSILHWYLNIFLAMRR